FSSRTDPARLRCHQPGVSRHHPLNRVQRENMDDHLLALLRQAKEEPHDDGPRLVLADYLEDRGDLARAEFIRLQCRVARPLANDDDSERNERARRSELLHDRHGGAWLGSLWRWWLSPLRWHRGLLSVRLPRRIDARNLIDVLPWIDTALFLV